MDNGPKVLNVPFMKFNVKQRKQPWIFEGLQAPPNLVCCADAISTGEKKKETSWPLAKD
ncbi:unnamed protein product [Brassica oleracea var. botrytis]